MRKTFINFRRYGGNIRQAKIDIRVLTTFGVLYSAAFVVFRYWI